jgi:hypothetical protein
MNFVLWSAPVPSFSAEGCSIYFDRQLLFVGWCWETLSMNYGIFRHRYRKDVRWRENDLLRCNSLKLFKIIYVDFIKMAGNNFI